MLHLGEKRTFEVGSKVQVIGEDRIRTIVSLNGQHVTLSDGRTLLLREVSLC